MFRLLFLTCILVQVSFSKCLTIIRSELNIAKESGEILSMIPHASALECALRCSIQVSCFYSNASPLAKTCHLMRASETRRYSERPKGWMTYAKDYHCQQSGSCFASCSSAMSARYLLSGVYHICPKLLAYCDMNTDSGGWTVIQRRRDGKQNFDKLWVDYKEGFGFADQDHWLGLDNIRLVLSEGNFKIRFDLYDWDGNYAYAVYTVFKVDSEQSQYSLTITGYEGTAGDSMSFHNGMRFSTMDKDYDLHGRISCSRNSGNGGWWYKNCHYVNLNGIYFNKGSCSASTCISWYQWQGHGYSLKHVEMKIKQN